MRWPRNLVRQLPFYPSTLGGTGRCATLMLLVSLLTVFPVQLCFAQVPVIPTNAGVNQSQIVVLKNGEILIGRVTPRTAMLEVQTDQGSILFQPTRGVDFVANSMEEAYRNQAARISVTDAKGQRALLQWCLKHELYTYAEQQISVLFHSDIDASELAQLDRQVQVALEARQNRRSSNPVKPAVPSSPTTQSTGLATNAMMQVAVEETDASTMRFVAPRTPVTLPDSSAPTIQQVAFNKPAEEASASTQGWTAQATPASIASEPQAEAKQEPGLTTRQMRERLRKLPRGSFRDFRRLEPVLLNGCFAAKCHAGASQLTFLNVSGTNPLGITQRNLVAALEHVDLANPEQSELWKAATRPHAGARDPIFPSDSESFVQLKAWLQQLTQTSDESWQTRSLETQSAVATQSPTASPSQNLPGRIQPAQPRPVDLKPLESLGDIPRLNRGSTMRPSRYVPVDPYDPEVFNRQLER